MEIDSYLSEKQKKKKRRRRSLFAVVAVLVAGSLFIGVGWLLFYSPLFRIQSIVIQGNDAVASDSVMALLQSSVLADHSYFKSLFGAKNILIWPSALTASQLKFIPQLASVTISKDYLTRTITATATERAPVGTWCVVPDGGSDGAPSSFESGETCYWFDGQGVLFGKTYDTQGSSIFVIHDYSQTGLGLGNAVLPAEFMPNLISIVDVLKASGVDVREAALKDIGLQEIDVTTYNGPDLYFSLRFPAANDLPVLQSLMAQPNFAKLQYVDFRVENRAYYK